MGERVFQAGLGTKFERAYKEGANVTSLLLAQVTKVNFSFNTVELITSGKNDVLDGSYINDGKFSAKLPVEFGGRNSVGQPYGQVKPVNVGDIVLVGFINQSKMTPIVLSFYGNADVNEMLSRTPFANADYKDPTLVNQTNQRFSLYPSLTYDNIDGLGNRTVTFTGKTFLMTDAVYSSDTNLTDGNHGTEYSDLQSSYYSNGEEIEPMNPLAPNILFKHQGITKKDDSEDTHVTMLHIKDDGTYRISTMQRADDWRTFFEMTPKGAIRLRKQFDSKIIGKGFEKSEIGIDEDGTVYLRSGGSELELRPDGIYSSGNIIGGGSNGGGTDLSGVYEAINTLDDKITILSTQFTQNEEEIKLLAKRTEITEGLIKDFNAELSIQAEKIESKVSEAQVDTIVNEAMKGISDELDGLREGLKDLDNWLDDLVKDGILTPFEKESILREWQEIQNEYPMYILQAKEYDVSTTKYTNAYNKLGAYLEPILLVMDENTDIDPVVFKRNFMNYYTERINLVADMLLSIKELAIEAMKVASQAIIDSGNAWADAVKAQFEADRANELLKDIASDGQLTPSEKQQLKRDYDAILREYEPTLAQGKKYEVPTENYTSVYTNLVAYVDRTGIFKNMQATTPVDPEELSKTFLDYYDEKVRLLKAITFKSKEVLDEYGDRIYIAETSIKQTQYQIDLMADKVETLDGRVEANHAQITIHSEEIKQKVTSTDVATIIKETEFGATNLLVNSGLSQDMTRWVPWGDNQTSYTRGRESVTGLTNINYGLRVTKPGGVSRYGFAQNGIEIMEGQSYTISVWAKTISGIRKVTLQKGSGTDAWDGTTKEVGTKWAKLTFTWKAEKNGETNYYIGFNAEEVGDAIFAGFKMEEGVVSTAWSPNAKDIAGDVKEEITEGIVEQAVDGAVNEINKQPIGGANYIGFSSGNHEFPRLMIKNTGYYSETDATVAFDEDMIKMKPKEVGVTGRYNIGSTEIATSNVGLDYYDITAVDSGSYLTFSCDIQSMGGNAKLVIYMLNSGVWKEYNSDIIKAGDKKRRAIAIGKVDQDTKGVLCCIVGLQGFTEVKFAKTQLEYGSRSTSWKKSNMDMQNDINIVVTDSKNEMTHELELVDIKTRLADSKLLFQDPNFEHGMNGISVYNDEGTSNPKLLVEPYAEGHTQPSGKPRLRITTYPDIPTSPGLGGLDFGNETRPNAEFVYEITAKIPVGYALEVAETPIGRMSKFKWLTKNTGTGNWFTYYYYIQCGIDGEFANAGYFYLEGIKPTTGNNVDWLVSTATAYDLNQSDRAETNTQLNGKEGTILKQPTEPKDVAIGVIWVDTTSVPNIPRRWTGTEWIKLTATEAKEVGAFDNSEGQNLIDRMSSAEQIITAESITNTVITSEDFTALYDNKANSDDLLDLATLEQLEGQYTAFEEMLNETIGSTYNTLFDRQSQLEQTVNNFDFKIQQAGGVNMIRNSLGFSGLDFWDNKSTVRANEYSSQTVVTPSSNLALFTKDWYTISSVNPTSPEVGSFSIDGVLTSQGAWTISFDPVVASSEPVVTITIKVGDAEPIPVELTVEANSRKSVTVDVPKITTPQSIVFGNLKESTTVFSNIKIEKNDKATSWVPNSIDTLDGASDLTTTIQDNSLAKLGFGSGFAHKAGGVSLTQEVAIPSVGTYTLSYYMKKSTLTGVSGMGGMEVLVDGEVISFIGSPVGENISSYTKFSTTFTTESLNVSIRMVAQGNINSTISISGVIMNIGSLALTWQPYPSEIYNTNVLIDINGITVKNNQTKGYTIITPMEFSGYAQVGKDMKRVFTLNGATTEVEELSVRTKITMGAISVISVKSDKNNGWAFIG